MEISIKTCKKGLFSPEWYIITTYNGEHYQLITYKKKRILGFKEIPYDIKNLILINVWKNAGPYNLIEDFRNLKKKVTVLDDDNDTTELHSDLFESNTVFMFHSNSQTKPKPGKGLMKLYHRIKYYNLNP